MKRVAEAGTFPRKCARTAATNHNNNISRDAASTEAPSSAMASRLTTSIDDPDDFASSPTAPSPPQARVQCPACDRTYLMLHDCTLHIEKAHHNQIDEEAALKHGLSQCHLCQKWFRSTGITHHLSITHGIPTRRSVRKKASVPSIDDPSQQIPPNSKLTTPSPQVTLNTTSYVRVQRPVCPKDFYTWRPCTRHIRNAHQNQVGTQAAQQHSILQCHVCGDWFPPTSGGLKKHMLHLHGVDSDAPHLPHVQPQPASQIKCPACPRTFERWSNCYIHIRGVHNNEISAEAARECDMLQCAVCENWTRSTQMKSHMKQAHDSTLSANL